VAQVGWDTAPAAIRAQIDALVAGLQHALGARARALMLHGSLACGCFNPASSDIDLLGIVDGPLSVADKRACADVLLTCSAQPAPIEISLLDGAVLAPFAHPTAFEFHFSEAWRAALGAAGWPVFASTDPDLATHIALSRARGIALFGAPPADVLPEVPRADLLDSFARDVFSSEFGIGALAAAQRPGDAILNACRSLAFVRDGQLRSKDEGALWAVIELPWRHASLAARALETYRAGHPARFEPDELQRFATFVRHEFFKKEEG
jgi:hypothetical protein